MAALLGLAVGAAGGRAQTVNVVETTPDQALLLAGQPAVSFAAGTAAGSATQPAITVDDTVRYQRLEGVGATFNDSGAYLVWNKLTPAQRTALMNDLFSTDGIHLNFLRQPMGATDLALSSYTYDDLPAGEKDPEMRQFSIAHDQAYMLPTLRAAIAANPAMKVLALPWSPPAWMKTSGALNGGTLDPANFAALAKYFARFIAAYERNGVPVNYVAAQNEPLYETTGYPSMFMNSLDEGTFIARYLGPTLERERYRNQGWNFAGQHEDAEDATPGILGYEHNWDNPKYPEVLAENPEVRRYLAGISFHCYAGNVADAQNAVHYLAGEPPIYFTECTGGSFAPDFASNLRNDTEGQVINVLRNWGKSVVFWNMALDQNYGPTVENGCRTCRGVVTIDTSSSPAVVTRNVEYYVLGHLAKYVQAGAYRIQSNSVAGGIEDVAFKNPDGSIAVLVLNAGSTASQFSLNWQGKTVSTTLPAGAVATLTWDGYTGTTFDVTAGPGSRTIAPGGATNFAVDLDRYAGDAQRVKLAVNGLPAGAFGQVVRNPFDALWSLPIVTGDGVASGTYPLTISGMAGGVVRSSTVDLTVGGKETPFGGTAWTLPGLIQAENFDEGGDYVGYFNLDGTDQGSAPGYRAGTTVGVENTGDTGGGYDVGYTKEGEWLRYTVNVTERSLYQFQARVASLGPGGYFHVTFDGENKTGTMFVPLTGDFQAYTTMVSRAFHLEPGQHVMQVTMDGNGPTGGMGNFNWFAVQPFVASTPYTGAAATVPGRIEAENFDAGGKPVAYWNGATVNGGGANARPGETVYIEACSDAGGGYDVGQTNPGDWLNYTAEIAAAGTYTMHVRVATGVGGGYFHLAVDGRTVTPKISVPQTNGFQTWQTLDIPGVELPQGRHVLQLVMDSGGYYNAVGNFNWFSFD